MRTVLILLVCGFCLSTSFAFAQKTDSTFTVKYFPGQRHGIYYTRDSATANCSVPVINKKTNGTCNCYYSNKKLASSGNYENGFKTGEWNYYFTSGQLAESINYLKNKKNGTTKIYYVATYTDLDLCFDKPPKNPKTYKVKHLLYSTQNYVNDTLSGTTTYYSTEGVVGRIIEYEKGVEKVNKKEKQE